MRNGFADAGSKCAEWRHQAELFSFGSNQMNIRMLNLSRRWRLFCGLLTMLLAVEMAAQAPAGSTTTIQDVVYRADGTPASGTLVISWPEFTSANNLAVAAGTMAVDIGPQGAISLALVPNAGGTPDGTYYKVVFKLDELKTHMRSIVGNGTPGRLQRLERQVERHEAIFQRSLGIGATAGILLTLIHLAIDYYLRTH